jgi:hypothetical protein
MRTVPLDHDIKIWVDAQTYLAILAAAKADDRSVSSYVRRLIAADLVRTASLMHQQHDSGEAVQGGDERASAGRGGAAG